MCGRPTFTVHDCNGIFMALKMVPHARDGDRNQCERRGMVVWERRVEYPAIHVFIFVAGALGTELPDAPVDAVFEVQETQDLVKRVAVSCFGELVGWHGHGDDGGVLAYVTQVKTGFLVLDSWAWRCGRAMSETR